MNLLTKCLENIPRNTTVSNNSSLYFYQFILAIAELALDE